MAAYNVKNSKKNSFTPPLLKKTILEKTLRATFAKKQQRILT